MPAERPGKKEDGLSDRAEQPVSATGFVRAFV